MFNSVSLSQGHNSKPETAGSPAVQSTPAPSIFSTETAGSIACSTPSAGSSGSFSAMA